jgi:hypothetical protein
VDLYAAICKVSKLGAWLQPEAIQDCARLFSSRHAKTGGIQQFIQLIETGHARAYHKLASA